MSQIIGRAFYTGFGCIADACPRSESRSCSIDTRAEVCSSGIAAQNASFAASVLAFSSSHTTGKPTESLRSGNQVIHHITARGGYANAKLLKI